MFPVNVRHLSRTLFTSLLVWLDLASSQIACLPPGRYFASAPAAPLMSPPAMAPAPGFFAASPPVIPPGCVPVIRPAFMQPAFAAPAVHAMPAMPAMLRSPPGFMPAAAFPAFTPAAAFPGLTPAAAFPAPMPAMGVPAFATAAAYGILPSYSPAALAIPPPMVAASPLLRSPLPCFPVLHKNRAKKADEPARIGRSPPPPPPTKLVFRRALLSHVRTSTRN